jgi:hypothetical protein
MADYDRSRTCCPAVQVAFDEIDVVSKGANSEGFSCSGAMEAFNKFDNA